MPWDWRMLVVSEALERSEGVLQPPATERKSGRPGAEDNRGHHMAQYEGRGDPDSLEEVQTASIDINDDFPVLGLGFRDLSTACQLCGKAGKLTP